jgi:malonyl CoA-acyl carrier protein transacylase
MTYPNHPSVHQVFNTATSLAWYAADTTTASVDSHQKGFMGYSQGDYAALVTALKPNGFSMVQDESMLREAFELVRLRVHLMAQMTNRGGMVMLMGERFTPEKLTHLAEHLAGRNNNLQLATLLNPSYGTFSGTFEGLENTERFIRSQQRGEIITPSGDMRIRRVQKLDNVPPAHGVQMRAANAVFRAKLEAFFESHVPAGHALGGNFIFVDPKNNTTVATDNPHIVKGYLDIQMETPCLLMTAIADVVRLPGARQIRAYGHDSQLGGHFDRVAEQYHGKGTSAGVVEVNSLAAIANPAPFAL